jgi:phosphorylase kinase alpha/beta subunit
MLLKSLDFLKQLETHSGLFRASHPNVKTGYDRIWIRDNIYISLAFEYLRYIDHARKIYQSLLDLLIKFEWKIDDVIRHKPTEDFMFLHPLYTDQLKETPGGWGWKQNDAIGGLLFKVCELEQKDFHIIRNQKDLDIIQKIVYYLESIRYWEDEDNGIWEENKEIHSSSLGACIAGLEKAKSIVKVDINLIENGKKQLFKQFPRESIQKEVDLSLLSLIYPYHLLNDDMSKIILHNVETHLSRNRGVIRYKNDHYYMNNKKEASWTMGFPWIAICYYMMNDMEKFKFYLSKSIEVLNGNLELPELFIEDKTPNENVPFGWGQSLIITAFSL